MMIKKTAKRALSVVLSLVLIATTFFIFDPSVFKIDTGAYVNIESNKASSTVALQNSYAPETIYLAPGSSSFKYFCNYNNITGKSTEPKSTSSYIYFNNDGSTDTKIAVNRVYSKGSDGDVPVAASMLSINSTLVTAYAECDSDSFDFENSSATIVAKGTNTVNYQITNGYLTGCEQNRTYYIEWVIRYVIDGAVHLKYMYTGVYCPSINMTGVATRSRYTGDGNTPELDCVAFITGAMKYAEKGNRYHAFTNTSYRAWGGTTGAGARTAPLIGFVGYKNDSTNNTVPNDDWNSENNFPKTSTDSGMTMLVAQKDPVPNKENPSYYTNFTDYGTYANPNPSGTISEDCDASGYQTGVAYMVVDTSRYTNYNQIPYLSAGFFTTYKKSGSYKSQIEYIKAKSSTLGDLDVNIYCSNDSGNHNDHEEHQTRTFGLYALNGPIYNGGFQLTFHELQGVNFYIGHRTMNVTQAVGLHTTTVNKESLRNTYNKALNSSIDNAYISASGSGLSYATYFNELKKAAEALCDPTNYSMSEDSTLSGYISSYSSAITAAFDSTVYFYVPEVIYLKPSTAGETTAVAFQNFADRSNDNGGTLLTYDVASKTTGNVYFSCTAAKSFQISVSKPDGCTINNVTLNSDINGTSYKTEQMTGSAYNKQGQKIVWTVTWKDASGYAYKVSRTSTIYKPNHVASGGAGRSQRSSWGKKGDMQGLIYINGFANSFTSGAYTLKDAYNTALNPGWALIGSHVASKDYLDSTTNGAMAYGDSDTVNHTLSGLQLFLDRSRYTNYAYIPNFTYTVAITNFNRTDENREGALCYDTTSASSTQPFYVSSNNLREQIYRDRIKAITPYASDSPSSHYFYGYFQGKYGGTGRTNVTINFDVYSYDKSALRDAYDYAVENSKYLQQEWYTTTAWTDYTTALNNVVNSLEGVEDTNVSKYTTYANTLKSQVNKMKAAVTAEAGTDTFSYKDASGATVSNQKREDVLNKSKVKVYHRYISGGSGSSTTTDALNAAVDGTTNVEPETETTYYYGETVKTGYNETKGYSYFGYYRSVGDTEWKSPADGDLVGNAPGPNKYGSSGHNQDILVAVPNLTYTYVYHKQDLSVCKDYGDSIQNFGTAQNLANLSAAAFNGSYADLGASGGEATVSDTSATGFSFSVTKVGTAGERYYNDIYIANAATGLTAGGTYTISFKSDLNYDDMAWYGNEFNSASGWKQNNDYRYTPGSMALYVLTTSSGTKALQKVETSYSTGGTVATFTLPSDAKAVNLVLRVFSDGTETYDGTITDFKIAEGQYVNEGVEGDTVTFDTPTRIGYTFQGWIEESSPFDGTLSGTLNTTYTFGCGNDVVLANWKANTYTVNLDANGGSCSLTKFTVTFDEKYGELPQPTRTGYTFDGWYTARSGGDKVESTTVVKTASDHTLFAHWSANTYTVYFNANTGVCDTASKVVTFDSTYGDLPTPTKTGYTFNGWFTATSGGSKVDSTTVVTTANDHTLYAQWTANTYTVTFNANGGSCSTASKVVTFDSTYGDLPTPARTGYTFTGWFTAETGGTKIETTTVVKTANDHMLYAQWTVNNYTVTFNANGGSCSTASKVVTFDSAYGDLPTPARTGYTFTGWFTAETGGTKVETSTVVKTADNHTLYAHWNANTYTVTFSANGGECTTSSKEVTFDSPYGDLPVPTKPCYTFNGWFTQADGGDVVSSSTVVTKAYNHVLYAQWIFAGHNYVDEVVPPTCTSEGYTIHTCTRCGDTYRDSFVALDSNAHSWVVKSIDSTTHTYECEYCHITKTEKHIKDMDEKCLCDSEFADGAYEVDIAYNSNIICFKYMPLQEKFDSSTFPVPVKYREPEYRVGHKTVLTPRADYQNIQDGDVLTYDAEFEYTDYAGGIFDVTVVDKGVTTVTSYSWEEKATIRSSWANFLYWVDEYGNIVSTYKVYYFLAVKDTTLTAVYKSDVENPSTEKAFIKTNFAECGDDGSLTFYSERCVNYQKYTLLSHGIILAPSQAVGNDYNTLYNSLVCNSGNSNILAYDKAIPNGKSAAKCYGLFTVAVPQKYLAGHSINGVTLDNDLWYARSYVLVENLITGEMEYHYGDIVEFDMSVKTVITEGDEEVPTWQRSDLVFKRRTDVKNDNLLITKV